MKEDREPLVTKTEIHKRIRFMKCILKRTKYVKYRKTQTE